MKTGHCQMQNRVLASPDLMMRGSPSRGRLAMPSGMAMAHSGQAIGGSYFRAPMPSIGHSLPSCLAPRIASGRGHAFAFSGVSQQLLCRVHRMISVGISQRNKDRTSGPYWAVSCPTMNDRTVKQIAAVKVTASKGSHTCISSHI
jgi:hypothetical protein